MFETRNPFLSVKEISREALPGLAKSGNLYAIIDSCRVPATPKKALALGEQRVVSLYRDTSEGDFWEVAPYLFSVNDEVLRWMTNIASDEAWGVFIASRSDLVTLRYHFRHFLKVQEPEGNIWHFRFYDPRVLKPFLFACTEQEARYFWGPVQAYGIAEPEMAKIVFIQEAISLSRSAEAPGRTYEFMFRLDPRHLEALRPQAEADFAYRIAKHMRKMGTPGVQGLPEKILIKRIRLGILRAHGYGIARESTIAAFVALMFQFAPNFDEYPKFTQVLTTKRIPPDDRIDELVLEASDEDRQEVRRKADLSLWRKSDSEKHGLEAQS